MTWVASSAVTFADMVVSVKLLATLPNAGWLIRFGPDIRRRCETDGMLNAMAGGDQERSLDGEMIRDNIFVFVERNGDFARKIREDETGVELVLREIKRNAWNRFPSSMRSGNRAEIALRTTATLPVVLFLTGLLVRIAIPSSRPGLVVYYCCVSTLSVSMAIVAAPVYRVMLGPFDMHVSALRRLVQFLRRRTVTSEEAGQLAVFLYFLSLILLSALTFAFAYDLLAVLADAKGTAPPLSYAVETSPLISSIYFSVATLATVGYGDVHPASVMGQYLASLQIITEPFLLSWIFVIAITQKRERTTCYSIVDDPQWPT